MVFVLVVYRFVAPRAARHRHHDAGRFGGASFLPPPPVIDPTTGDLVFGAAPDSYGVAEVALGYYPYAGSTIDPVDNVHTFTITVIPTPDDPVADAGGPYSVFGGQAIRLDGSRSHDPDDPIVAYRWDLDGDGQFGETGADALNGDEVGCYPVFVPNDLSDEDHLDPATSAFEVDLEVCVLGEEGTPMWTHVDALDPNNSGAAYVTLLNDTPGIDVGPDITVERGERITPLDPLCRHGAGALGRDGGLRRRHGNADAHNCRPEQSVHINYVYANSGDYTISVTVADAGTGSSSDSLQVHVTNAAPKFTSTPIRGAEVGALYEYAATAEDTDQGDQGDGLKFRLQSVALDGTPLDCEEGGVLLHGGRHGNLDTVG